MTPSDRLNLLRKKLDSLVKARFERPLDLKAERSYQALCERERELLGLLYPEAPEPDWLSISRGFEQ